MYHYSRPEPDMESAVFNRARYELSCKRMRSAAERARKSNSLWSDAPNHWRVQHHEVPDDSIDGFFDRDKGPPGYELLDEVGRGGMGVVYRARDAAFGRDVAVKLL